MPPTPPDSDRTGSSQADPLACPLCGDENRCALEVERVTGIPQPPCWCTRLAFDPAVLERIPAQFRRISCVCPACAAGRPGDHGLVPPTAG